MEEVSVQTDPQEKPQELVIPDEIVITESEEKLNAAFMMIAPIAKAAITQYGLSGVIVSIVADTTASSTKAYQAEIRDEDSEQEKKQKQASRYVGAWFGAIELNKFVVKFNKYVTNLLEKAGLPTPPR